MTNLAGHTDTAAATHAEASDDRAVPLRYRWEKAMRGAGLRPMVRLYLHNLATYMDPDGNGCFPSAQRQADDLGVKRATIFALQQEAADLGWVTVLKKQGRGVHGGQGLTNRYLPLVPGEQQSGEHQTVEEGRHAGNSRVNTEGNRRVSARPEHPTEHISGNPPTARADEQRVTSLVVEHWGRGRKQKEAVQSIMALHTEVGWTWDDVAWLVTSNHADADGPGALLWRLGRVKRVRPERARHDRELLAALGQGQVRQSKKSSTRAGRPGDFAGGADGWRPLDGTGATAETADDHAHDEEFGSVLP